MRLLSPRSMCLCLLFVVACGGSENIPGGGGGGAGDSHPCTITLSGAITGAFACTDVPAVARTMSQNQTGFVVAYGTLGQTDPAVAVSFDFSGQPPSGSVASTATGATGGVIIQTPSALTWWADVGTGNDTGSWSVTFSTATPIGTTEGATSYAVHGSLDMTAPAKTDTGSAGTTTIHAEF
jgi:hypothetical protein